MLITSETNSKNPITRITERLTSRVKIESLDSWSTLVGAGYAAARDTFYARLMLPQIARSEIVQSFFDGGS